MEFDEFWIFDLISVVFLTLPFHMRVYGKSYNVLCCDNTGWEGGSRTPLNRLFFGSELWEKAKDSKCQLYMRLMYWTYIFRLVKKISVGDINYFI